MGNRKVGCVYEDEWGLFVFFFSSRRRHTRYWRDWSSDVCSSDLLRKKNNLQWNLNQKPLRYRFSILTNSARNSQLEAQVIFKAYNDW